MKTIDKPATRAAIIEKCTTSKALSINVQEFDEKIVTDEDYIEACDFIRIQPIYIES